MIVIAYSSSVDRKLDESYAATVANGLRQVGVDVVAPHSIDTMHTDAARVALMSLFDGTTLKRWPFEWMQSMYDADRCVLVRIHSEDTTAPDPNARVSYVRITAEYRAYDLPNRNMLHFGSTSTVTGNHFPVDATVHMLLGLGRTIGATISTS